MHEHVRSQVLHLLTARWQVGERVIASEDLYQQLVHAGIPVPNGVLAEVCADLLAAGLIRAPGTVTSRGVEQHGALLINRIDPALR